MLERIWKGVFGKQVCGAEIKLGTMIVRGRTCELPAGHKGPHQIGVRASWQQKDGEKLGIHRPGGKEDL